MWDLQTTGAIAGLVGVSVLTVVRFICHRIAERKRMVDLENYLRDRKKNHSTWEHGIDRLVLNTSLSREQIEKAAKQSKKINRIPRVDQSGMVAGYRLEWKGKP